MTTSFLFVGQALLALLLLFPLSTLGEEATVPCSGPSAMQVFDADAKQPVALTPEYNLKDFIRQRGASTSELSVDVLCDCDAAAYGLDSLPIHSSTRIFGLGNGNFRPVRPTIDFANVKGPWMAFDPSQRNIIAVHLEFLNFRNLRQSIEFVNVAFAVRDCSFHDLAITPLRVSFDSELFLASGGKPVSPPPKGSVSRTTFKGNGWMGGAAGAIDINENWSGSTIEISKSDFNLGKGTRAGAIALKIERGKALLYQNNFNRNLATKAGGALSIQTEKDGEVWVTTSKFTDNGAYVNGGSVYIAGKGKVSFSANELYHSLAGAMGGALFVAGPSAPRLSLQGASAPRLSLQGEGEGEEVDSPNIFGKNLAGHKGGGIFYAPTVVDAIEVVNSRFEKNEATGWSIDFSFFPQSNAEEEQRVKETFYLPRLSGKGGAIFFEGGDEIVNDQAVVRVPPGISFVNNAASHEGGAICAVGRRLIVAGDDTDDESQAATFVDNRAGHGGAILVEQAPEVILGQLVFDSNNAIIGEGGAVSVRDSERCSVTDTAFRRNKAADVGGGLVVENTNLGVVRSVFDQNESVRSGGAVSIHSVDEATFTESSFTGNTGYPAGAVSVEFRGRKVTKELFFKNELSNVVFQECMLAENQVHVYDDQWPQRVGAAVYFVTADRSDREPTFQNVDKLDPINQGSPQDPLLQLTMNRVLTINNFDNSGSDGRYADIRIQGPAMIASIDWYAAHTFASKIAVQENRLTALETICRVRVENMSAAEINCKDCVWYHHTCLPSGSSQLCNTYDKSCLRPSDMVPKPLLDFTTGNPGECFSLLSPKTFRFWQGNPDYWFYCVLLAKSGYVTPNSAKAVWLIPSNQALKQWGSSLNEIRRITPPDAKALVAAHSITSLRPQDKYNSGGKWLADTLHGTITVVPPAFRAMRLSKMGKPLFGPVNPNADPLDPNSNPPVQSPPGSDSPKLTSVRKRFGDQDIKASITEDFLETSEEPFDINRILLIDAVLFPPPHTSPPPHTK